MSPPLKVLLVHNRYKESGGEDAVVQAEQSLLLNNGHSVSLLEADNVQISSPLGAFGAGLGTPYSVTGRRRVATALARFRPDVMHVHNFFPLFSPSIYYAARAAGVPVVQTLHNYRLLCANAIFLREGRVCEDCLGKRIALSAVRHACYRGNRPATAAIVSMLTMHRALGTWRTMIDAYIALTQFGLDKFAAGGIPRDRLFLKPNFIHPAPMIGNGDGGFAVFVGRLSQNKGIQSLLAACKILEGKIRVKIIGDGPLMGEVRAAAQSLRGVEVLGHLARDRVAEQLRQAQILILPSIWYEGLPMVMIEALATGVPVVAANIGAMPSIVEDGCTGLLFRPGDSDDLAAKVEWLMSHEVDRQRMRQRARAVFEAQYTAQSNHTMLMSIYDMALRRRR